MALDTLRRDTFAQITRRDRLPDVLAALDGAAAAGLTPVKINAVLLRGINDHEAADMLGFAIERGYHLRFIEQFAAQGAQVVTSTPDEFREFVRQEIASSGAVVRAAGLKVE